MYKATLALISILVAGSLGVAQQAQDFFHRGAQFYIHGKKPEAKQEIFTGLQLFPQDPLLQAMAGLLAKEEKQQESQQQQQDQQQQEQEQQNQEQKQNQQSSGAEEKKEEQSESDQQKQEQQSQQSASSKEGGEDPQDAQGQQQAETGQPGKMTPEQARRLLDSQKGDEKMLPVPPNNKRVNPRRGPLRDW